MSIRIGINPLTWTNDDLPELGDDIPLETCLAEAKTAGYAGMELGHKFPRTPGALSDVTKRAGLDVVSGWYSSALLERSVAAEIDALEPHLQLLHAVGCNVLVLCETTRAIHGSRTTPLSKRPTMDDAQWKRLCTGLDALGAHTLERGIKLAYHHHMGCVVQTDAEIDRLMASTGRDVFLLLDTGHATYAGGDPVALARKHGARVAHVHTKDVRRDVLEKCLRDDSPFLEAVLAGVFTVPGDGSIDFNAVLRQLAPYKYSGWLVVEAEQDPKKANPLKYATMGFQSLSGFARDSGL